MAVAHFRGMRLHFLVGLIAITGCQNLQLSSDQGVFKLTGTGAHDVWAIAGEKFANHDRVLHYDGGWSEAQKFSGDDLGAIHARGAGDVWVAGKLTMYHYDGSNWSNAQAPDAMIAIGDEWAVGAHGAVMARDGAAWRAVLAPSSMTVAAAWGTSSADLWGVVNGTVQHFDGHAWELAPAELPGNLQLSAIWGSGADDVWAVGYGARAHYDGQHWTSVTLPTSTPMFAVWGPAAGDVWASGYDDTLLRNWSPMSHPTENSCGQSGTSPCTQVELDDIWGSAANDVWIAGYLELAVGGKPLLRHFDGTSWTSVSVP